MPVPAANNAVARRPLQIDPRDLREIALTPTPSPSQTSSTPDAVPEDARTLGAQSSSQGASPTFQAPVPAGQTAARLGGMRDWQPPSTSLDDFMRALSQSDDALTELFAQSGASMSDKIGGFQAVPDGKNFIVTADLVDFMSGAKRSSATFRMSPDLKILGRVDDPHTTTPHTPAPPSTPATPAKVDAAFERPATDEERAFAVQAHDDSAVMAALFMAGGGSMSSSVGPIEARRDGDGWIVHAEIANFMTGDKIGDARVRLGSNGKPTNAGD